MYYQTFLSKEELFEKISRNLHPALVSRVISAYETAENAYYNRVRADSMPVFFHITRVSKILLDELEIFEPDLIIASLLHDVFISKTEINHNIISFNFGYYVTFLVDTLTDDALEFKADLLNQSNLLEIAGLDGFIIRLAEILDELRCIEQNNDLLPIPFYTKVTKRYFSNIEHITNDKILYLVNQIKKEGNKLLQ